MGGFLNPLEGSPAAHRDRRGPGVPRPRGEKALAVRHARGKERGGGQAGALGDAEKGARGADVLVHAERWIGVLAVARGRGGASGGLGDGLQSKRLRRGEVGGAGGKP